MGLSVFIAPFYKIQLAYFKKIFISNVKWKLVVSKLLRFYITTGLLQDVVRNSHC